MGLIRVCDRCEIKIKDTPHSIWELSFCKKCKKLFKEFMRFDKNEINN